MLRLVADLRRAGVQSLLLERHAALERRVAHGVVGKHRASATATRTTRSGRAALPGFAVLDLAAKLGRRQTRDRASPVAVERRRR